jgi:hypothetical protein
LEDVAVRIDGDAVGGREGEVTQDKVGQRGCDGRALNDDEVEVEAAES